MNEFSEFSTPRAREDFTFWSSILIKSDKEIKTQMFQTLISSVSHQIWINPPRTNATLPSTKDNTFIKLTIPVE